MRKQFFLFWGILAIVAMSCKQMSTPAFNNASMATKSTQIAPTDTILWNEHVHDFKDIPSGPPASTRFTFVNFTKSPVTITKLEPGCSCTATEYRKGEIAPNDTGWIVASYKTANTFGYFRKHIDVGFSNGKNFKLMLMGNVDPMKEIK